MGNRIDYTYVMKQIKEALKLMFKVYICLYLFLLLSSILALIFAEVIALVFNCPIKGDPIASFSCYNNGFIFSFIEDQLGLIYFLGAIVVIEGFSFSVHPITILIILFISFIFKTSYVSKKIKKA